MPERPNGFACKASGRRFESDRHLQDPRPRPGGETGNRATLRRWCRKACEFESHPGHQRASEWNLVDLGGLNPPVGLQCRPCEFEARLAHHSAPLAEQADAPRSNRGAQRRPGSNPGRGTNARHPPRGVIRQPRRVQTALLERACKFESCRGDQYGAGKLMRMSGVLIRRRQLVRIQHRRPQSTSDRPGLSCTSLRPGA